MKAYGIFQETVKDEAMFAEYRKHVMPTLAAHGGKFVVRGGALSVVEGEWPHPRLVIIEFPSRAAAGLVPVAGIPGDPAAPTEGRGRQCRVRRWRRVDEFRQWAQ